MKKASAIAWLALALLPAGAFAAPATLKVQQPDNRAIRGISLRVSEQGTVHFRPDYRVSPEAFFAKHKLDLGLTEQDELREISRMPGLAREKEEVVRFRQYHQGIPVEGAEYVVQRRDEALSVLKGRVAEGLSLDVSSAMKADKALTAALGFVEARVFAWESPELKAANAVAELEARRPKGALIIVKDPTSDLDNPTYILTWRFVIQVAQPFGVWHVYVDAATGNLVKVLSGIEEASNAIGTVNSVYNGTHNNLSTRSRGWPYNDHILKDMTRGEITVKNGQNFLGWNLSGHINQGSNTWSRREASAHWAAQRSHDYFRNVHGRSGVNGSNEELRIITPGEGTYYQDDGSQSYICIQNLFESLDVVGHEFTHGVVRHTSNLVYERDSGALNESFADIFGTMVEREVVGDANYNWLMGADFGAIRDLQTPNNFGDPQIRGDWFWVPQPGCVPTGGSGGNDFCGVHTNSGVQNRWFSLLVDGGTQNGVAVAGVGEGPARAVAYRNMTVELFAGANYDDARANAIDAANVLYGFCSNVVAQVTNAWAAVGVGAPFGTCVPPLNVWIDGPYQSDLWSTVTFNGNVSGGVAPFTYQWAVDGYPAGNDPYLWWSFGSEGYFQITLTVTDSAGQVSTAWHSISIGTCGGGQFCELPF